MKEKTRLSPRPLHPALTAASVPRPGDGGPRGAALSAKAGRTPGWPATLPPGPCGEEPRRDLQPRGLQTSWHGSGMGLDFPDSQETPIRVFREGRDPRGPRSRPFPEQPLQHSEPDRARPDGWRPQPHGGSSCRHGDPRQTTVPLSTCPPKPPARGSPRTVRRRGPPKPSGNLRLQSPWNQRASCLVLWGVRTCLRSGSQDQAMWTPTERLSHGPHGAGLTALRGTLAPSACWHAVAPDAAPTPTHVTRNQPHS